ncbi:MAG: methyl-accepting chemotaxis protein [Syntrophomonadaceae bacterium]|nr:methyl-accepting chemotaxis protein [Syntrophomonadaceae bacterium]
MNSLSIRNKIAITFGIIIMITVGTLTVAACNLQKEQFLRMTESQLQDSARNVVEKVSVMQALLDSRRFDGKFAYYLSNQRSTYLERGYHLTQYVISNGGVTVKAYGPMQKIPVNARQRQEMFKQQHGILHVVQDENRYTIAYEFSLERQSVIALLVPEVDYLRPVYHIRNIIMAVGLLALLVSYLATLFIILGITRPIDTMVEGLKDVEAGDFDIRLPEEGTAPELSVLGTAFNRMVEAIRYFLSEIKQIVTRLNHSSAELAEQAYQVKRDSDGIALALKEIGKSVNQQVASVDRTRAVSTRLVELVEGIASYNTISVAISREILSLSARGQEAIDEVRDGMNQVCKAAMDTRVTFDRVSEQVERIQSVNTAVDDIARQTKLLSLNAAIEASRAGEAGRSFGVVAEEIRKLSQESQDFSQQTASLVHEVMSEFHRLKVTLDHMNRTVKVGAESVENTRDVFGAIREQVVKNNNSIEDVFQGTHSMLALINEVAKEVNLIHSDSQAIASSIPNMLGAVFNQAENTALMLEHSCHLAELAVKLQQVIDSMGSGNPEQDCQPGKLDTEKGTTVHSVI